MIHLPNRTPRAFTRCAWAIVALALVHTLAACGPPAQEDPLSAPCTSDGRALHVGFYAFFEPVSYSADPDPGAAGFQQHRGYEADLLTALEALDGAGLSFIRYPIQPWDDIWLTPTGDDLDMVGGGITILDSRTRNAAGAQVVRFTSGHITFRQSLLVRAGQADRFSSYDRLTSRHRVGALAGTTGEARLLELTGLVDSAGVLAAGTRVHTRSGVVVADGSAAYVITAANVSPDLEGRQRLEPQAPDMPQVVYLGDESGEAELLQALRDGGIDALARGEIGNRDAVHASGHAFEVAALDTEVEYGGFALAADAEELAACIDAKINWLTDNRRIGYAEWRNDPSVFLRRAETWRQ
ncbi:MAG: transporter substrate-binding domain-containing protein [Chloroflexi bacterium]|nr:transporter substrate-binding domain-containing protein [Chloroflexota bacterium]